MSTTTKPKTLKRPFPHATWWLKRTSYFMYMMRDFTAIFGALCAVGVIFQVQAVKAGTLTDFNTFLSQPGLLFLTCLTLAFALLHTITWFMLAGKVMYLQVGEYRIPPAMIVAGHFFGWFFVSAVLAYLVVVSK